MQPVSSMHRCCCCILVAANLLCLSLLLLFRYGGEHLAPELQKEAVYGLTEIYRESIKPARLVANPGCYPTSVQLPLYPLLKNKLILKDDIIIDSKSGTSGRSPLIAAAASPRRQLLD